MLVAEDEVLLKDLYRFLLERTPGFIVADACEDGATAVRRYCELRPDVVMVDLNMPGLNGFEVTEAIRRIDTDSKVLIVSVLSDAEAVARALRAGAIGFVSKTALHNELLDALRTVATGTPYLSGAIASRAALHMAASPPPGEKPTLTRRQLQVLKLICAGLTTKRIAKHLSISEKTVQTHRQRLMRTLDTHDAVSLVKCAIELGLVEIAPLHIPPISARSILGTDNSLTTRS